MLRGIRKASGNWLGKLVMGAVVSFLVISFAIWGVGDIFRGFGRSTVASIGSTEISIEQFRLIYNERLQQVAAQLGRPVPAEQARALGLDRQILGQVMSDAALDERARQLKLGITDAEVARQIRDYPAFRGPGGGFDHDTFVQRLRSAGYNEQRFVAEQRRLMVRNHLAQSVSAIAAPPKIVLEAANRFQNERRAIEYIVLGREQAGEIPDPTAEQLASYFDARRATFRAPEYRRLTTVTLMPAEVAKWMTVSDDDAKRIYDSRRSDFVTPGRRQVQQIIFPSEDEAKAIKERIDAGATFEDIAKARGIDEKDIDLGFVTRESLFRKLPTGQTIGSQALAEAAFSLAEGKVSDPVPATLGTALIRVVKIEPDKTKPFEEAKEGIKQEVVRERTRDEVNQKHDKVEDERAGGATLAEAAQKAGASATTIDAVDRSGKDPSGAPVTGLPPEADVLAQAFTTDVGVETDALRAGENGYVWFEVTGITPSADRKLEDVKDKVEQRWRDEQIAERLTAKAKELTDKINGGAGLADVATAENVKAETATELRRATASPGLSVPTVNAVYATSQGAVGSAEGLTPAERTIFRVTEIKVPPIEAGEQAQRIEETLRNSIAEDLLRQYVAVVEKELGADINADALRRVTGGEN